MEPRELTLETSDELRLAARAWGQGGVPLLALHGWLDNAASYDGLGPLLAAAGYEVVALDLPGHGRSDPYPQAASYHFVDWVVHVAAAADALGWERFVLVGHSMGGAIASLLAGTLPERITRLVLIEGLGPNSVPPAEAPERLARSIAQRGRRGARPARPHADQAAAAARLREVNPGLSEQAARALAARGTREAEGGWLWRSDPRLRDLSPFRITEEHVHAFLARIGAPTLLVYAEAGYPADPGLMEARMAQVPHLTRLRLPGGHHLHLDTPEVVAPHLLEFLAGEQAAPAPAPALASEAAVRLVVLDVDGVLTDGALDFDAEGREGKRFHVRDGQGIKLLLASGLEVAWISGRASTAAAVRARELGVPHVLLGVAEKLGALQDLLGRLGLPASQVAYMGDDLGDLAALRTVGFPAAPADACLEAKSHARLVTRARGGEGAVRELAEHLLRAQGKWVTALTHLPR